MEERRRLKRFDLRLPAMIRVLGPEQGPKASNTGVSLKILFTKNISAGGAFLLTTKELLPGTPVEVQVAISIENGEDFENRRSRVFVKGKVLRSDQTGTAIRFDRDYKMKPVLKGRP